jgi:hypothetical protein
MSKVTWAVESANSFSRAADTGFFRPKILSAGPYT